jgi:hypothetical protein
MDPFLEAPGLFPDLHDSLINGIRDSINAALRAPYFTAIASRVFIELADRLIGPDVAVVLGDDESLQSSTEQNSGLAIAPPPVEVQPVVIRVPHDEVRELYLEIRTSDDERLVTTIELLSLTNKSPGDHRRDLYKKKQRELLERDVHLVEIDLLRGGQHTTAVPLELIERKTGWFDYHISAHRFDQREYFQIYAIRLPSRLPKIAIPLLPGDPDVIVNLQEVFDRCYDAALYNRRVRYSAAIPLPPLREDELQWVKELLGRNE